MRPVNSYNSKYGKYNNKPVGIVTKDQSQITLKFTYDEVIVDYDVVNPC